MAWITMNLSSLLTETEQEGITQDVPVPGALEAVTQLLTEGHRLTVITERFAPMPASERDRLKLQIEDDLLAWGFPPLEVWTGTTMPASDIDIGPKNITFDQDWPLALVQARMMLEERDLVPGPIPDNGEVDPALDGTTPGGEEPPDA